MQIVFITNLDKQMYAKNFAYIDICSKEVSNDFAVIQTPGVVN